MRPPTKREAEVVRLMMRGLHRREIAADLCISEKTVDAHLAHIREDEERPPSHVDMIVYAMKHGLVPPDSALAEALAEYHEG